MNTQAKTPASPKRIVIVDDNLDFRQALRFILESIPEVVQIEEAPNAEHLPALIRNLAPDIVFMDIEMPGINGIDATKMLISHNAKLKIIALSFHSEFSYVQDMIFAGARNYLCKNEMTRDHIRQMILQ